MGKCKNKDIVEVNINDLTIKRSKQNIVLIKPKHLEIIRKYDALNKVNNCTDITRYNLIMLLITLAKRINKPYNQMTIDDVNGFLASYKGNSLEYYKMSLKKFFIWLKRPGVVEHLKHISVEEKLTPEDMWSEEEILQLLRHTDADDKKGKMDRAIISLLYDCALERKVIHTLNIGDIYDSGKIMRIKVTGKKRGKIKTFVLECINSDYYMRQWLGVHPKANDKNAPLFISLNYRTIGRRINESYTASMLKTVAKRTGINKRITPHLLRHSKATSLYKKGVRGKSLAHRLRHWSLLTQERYTHLFQEDIEDEIFKAETGIDRNQRDVPRKIPLMLIRCPKCGTINDPTNWYCSNNDCMYALNPEMLNMELAVTDLLRSKWYKDIKESLKEQEKQGQKVPIEVLDVERLAMVHQEIEMMKKLSEEELKDYQREKEKKIIKDLLKE